MQWLTGPKSYLLSFRIIPKYWKNLADFSVEMFITTFIISFIRLLILPMGWLYSGKLNNSILYANFILCMIYFVSVPGNYIVRLIFSFDLEARGTYQNDNYVFEEQMDDIFQE